jgi:hypothetical protein
MSADKHFHPPAPVPDFLEDHQPDDMPAARSIVFVLLGLFVVCAIIAVVINGL